MLTHNRTHDSTDGAIDTALVALVLAVEGICSVGVRVLKDSVDTAPIMAVEDDIGPPRDSVYIGK